MEQLIYLIVLVLLVVLSWVIKLSGAFAGETLLSIKKKNGLIIKELKCWLKQKKTKKKFRESVCKCNRIWCYALLNFEESSKCNVSMKQLNYFYSLPLASLFFFFTLKRAFRVMINALMVNLIAIVETIFF